jgi:hypothetical protein
MFEPKTAPLLPWPAFRRRLFRNGAWAVALLLASLAGGTWGFWYLAGQTPIDGGLNSAMLLGGMGPVGEIRSTSGKLFAAAFALYAGLAFLAMASLLFAPVFHRALHTFHLEGQDNRGKVKQAERRRPKTRS